MRTYNHNRRNNNRGNRPNQNPKGVFETAGPAGKFRGTPQQLMDRYLVLGKESLSKREYTKAEELFQFAEHYRRLVGNMAAEQTKTVPDQVTQGEPKSPEQALKADTAEETELPSFLMADEMPNPTSISDEDAQTSSAKKPVRRKKTATKDAEIEAPAELASGKVPVVKARGRRKKTEES